MKKFYFANSENMDNIYGGESPVCVDYAEIVRLAQEWEMSIDEMMEQFHEASDEEMNEYGTYEA